MEDPVLYAEIATDWLLRAQPREHGLNRDSPVSAGVSHHPEPTPLDFDVHRGLEVGIMLSGQQERHFEDLVVAMGPGEAWMCAMWEPHGWRAVLPDTRAVVCTFLPEFLGDESFEGVHWLAPFAVPPSERPRVRDARTRATVLAIGEELRAEVERKAPQWRSAFRLGVLRLLLTLLRDWTRPNADRAGTRVRATYLSRIMPALTMLHADPSRRLTLPAAAAACNLSRSRFTVLFREAMGMSFANFRLRARLAFAAHQLLTTDRPTEAVARETGFADASHLHRAFVKHYGSTPGQFRQQAR